MRWLNIWDGAYAIVNVQQSTANISHITPLTYIQVACNPNGISLVMKSSNQKPRTDHKPWTICQNWRRSPKMWSAKPFPEVGMAWPLKWPTTSSPTSSRLLSAPLLLGSQTPRVSTRAWSWQAQLSTLHAWCVWSPWHRVGPGEDAMAPSTKIQSVQRNIVQNVKRNIAQIGANGSK